MTIDPAIFSELKIYFKQKSDFAKGKFTVVSAYPLSLSEKEKLLSSLRRLGQKEESVEYRIDKNILAGVILKTGSTIIDLSLLGQLGNLKQNLYENT